MERQTIKQELENLYQQPLKEGYHRRIVIWHDKNEDFKEELRELAIENVELVEYHYHNAFHVRYQLEKQLANSNILLYVPHEKNDTLSNPLIDVYFYSEHYLSDANALMLREFNLPEQCRHLVEETALFFRTADNRKKFSKLLKVYSGQQLTSEIVENCILAALCNLPYAEFNDILIAVIKEELNQNPNKYLQAFEKRGTLNLFWKKINERFGYGSDHKTIPHFLKSLFGTYLLETMTGWEGLTLDNRQNARIFMEEHLMKSSYPLYKELSEWMAEELEIKALMNTLEVGTFKDSGAFALFTEKIIVTMVQEILDGIYSPPTIRELIHQRQTMFWDSVYGDEYACVQSALDLLDALGDYDDLESQALFKRYVDHDYLVDQAYRHFLTAFNKLETIDRIEPLKQLVENKYVSNFMLPLSQNWNEAFAKSQGEWEIDGIQQQRQFFFNHGRPDAKKCKVIIISDGLRYEIAEELRQRLVRTGIKSSNLALTAYQSVMPSITELGMAALLPHSNQLTLDDEGTVFVKGINSNGLSNRRKILNPEAGRMAYDHAEVSTLTQKEFRKKFTDYQVVYIYHNVIDGRGDNAKTEKEVFDAVQKSFEDIEKLLKQLNQIKRIKDIYITADHGFLYQESPLIEADKLPTNKAGVIKAKRRYLLSKKPLDLEGALAFEISKMVGQKMYVTVPKGQQRFKMQGPGVNYVHGGAMPQEFIVPLLHYQVADIQAVESVNVICRVLNKRLTSHEVAVDFIQTEILVDGKSPTWIKAYFEDSFGALTSTTAVFLCNSESDKIDERTYKQKLVIMNRDYLKGEVLTLVVENESNGDELQRVDFVVDL